MKPETIILTFEEFDAFWLGAAQDLGGVEITIDGDLGMVFLERAAH